MGQTIIQVELWALITFLVGLLITCIGAVFGGAKMLLGQMDRRLDERFAAQEKARGEDSTQLRSTLAQHLEQERVFQAQLQELERRFLEWRGDLPLNYVRREDYIRGQSVIESKLDALYSKLEVVQLKGASQ